MRALLATCSCVSPAASRALRSSLPSTDGTFNNADWTITPYSELSQPPSRPTGTGGSETGTQVASGGNLGSYRRIDFTVNAAPASPFGVLNTFYGLNLKVIAIYSPVVSGAIQQIDYAEDGEMLNGFGTGQATGLALLQNGIYYIRTAAYVNQSAWTHNTLTGLRTSDLVQLGGSGHPDFSATGAPITFGFARDNATGPNGVAYSIIAAIDNWSVNVVQVPEPTCLSFLALTGMAVAARNRRQSR